MPPDLEHDAVKDLVIGLVPLLSAKIVPDSPFDELDVTIAVVAVECMMVNTEVGIILQPIAWSALNTNAAFPPLHTLSGPSNAGHELIAIVRVMPFTTAVNVPVIPLVVAVTVVEAPVVGVLLKPEVTLHVADSPELILKVPEVHTPELPTMDSTFIVFVRVTPLTTAITVPLCPLYDVGVTVVDVPVEGDLLKPEETLQVASRP